LRAAVVERGYIFKDFKRMGLLLGISLVLLVVIGMAQSAILAR
jgi:hypothetical protein